MGKMNKKEQAFLDMIRDYKFALPTKSQLQLMNNDMLKHIDKPEWECAYYKLNETINGVKYEKIYHTRRYGKDENCYVFFSLYYIIDVTNDMCAERYKIPMSWHYDDQQPFGQFHITRYRSFVAKRCSEGAFYIPNTRKEYSSFGNAVVGELCEWCYAKYNFVMFNGVQAELMQRNGYDELLKDLFLKSKPIPKYLSAPIKVMMRHKYECKDWSKWLNLMKFNKTFKNDLHNPKFVCPSDLNTEYNKYTDKYDNLVWNRTLKARETRREREEQEMIRRYTWYAKMVKEREEEERKRREQEKKMKESYPKRLKKYLDIVIESACCRISVLQNVEEFEEEGKAMRNCVYRCGYWKKANTIILSAKNKGGERLATIELNTKSWTILQCRSVCNGVPPLKDKIEQLIMNNIELFKHPNKLRKAV